MQTYFFKRAYYGNEEPPEVKTFTQDQVNAMMAENKRKLQDQVKILQTELDKAKAGGADTKALNEKIAELNNSLLTKEEIAKQERERLESEAKANIDKLAKETSDWKGRYDQVLVRQDIISAAAKHNAYDPDQLLMLFGSQAKVAPVTDAQGNATGEYKVVMPMTLEGKTVEMSPDQAVEQLRKDKKYANLFKATGIPGTGTTLNNTSTPTDTTIPTGTGDYMARRADMKAKGLI